MAHPPIKPPKKVKAAAKAMTGLRDPKTTGGQDIVSKAVQRSAEDVARLEETLKKTARKASAKNVAASTTGDDEPKMVAVSDPVAEASPPAEAAGSPIPSHSSAMPSSATTHIPSAPIAHGTSPETSVGERSGVVPASAEKAVGAPEHAVGGATGSDGSLDGLADQSHSDVDANRPYLEQTHEPAPLAQSAEPTETVVVEPHAPALDSERPSEAHDAAGDGTGAHVEAPSENVEAHHLRAEEVVHDPEASSRQSAAASLLFEEPSAGVSGEKPAEDAGDLAKNAGAVNRPELEASAVPDLAMLTDGLVAMNRVAFAAFHANARFTFDVCSSFAGAGGLAEVIRLQAALTRGGLDTLRAQACEFQALAQTLAFGAKDRKAG